ncbi:hypothetical protein CLV58_102160 [Spirosoma oryzae]|uniref:Uncharacterized protein n=1 Tax=Spirosoma oryzae TaxID=1469603 RepID=A0A2T0TI84_9BACT|nr:hypothetical protein [Spirosoma oryzae]PRY45412.1 hypothetical protein CLV58_102160 [Spirosoma oryzae]
MDKQQNFEKNPLDELFARKLGKLERPPSPDSFARLQQRMQSGQEQPRMVMWRNPTLQIAVAACVAIAFLMGWLYTGDKSGSLVTGSGQAVAIQKQQSEKPANYENKGLAENATVDKATQVAQTANTITSEQGRSVKPTQPKTDAVEPSVNKQLIAGKVASPKETQPEMTTPVVAKSATEAVATTKATSTAPVKPAERVLVVTIEEPEALVAARQTAASVVNNMPVLAASSSKEAKATFWQQVKRLKQDDDVARKEDHTDESGLLSRAYKGIKQRLEKDKQTKQ